MKEMPQRSTRGKRMNDLIGEEKEYDGMFWGQELFKETVSDDEYESESEKEDKFDEDFFKVESSEDETEEPRLEKAEKFEKIKAKPQKQKKKQLKFHKTPGITQKEMLEQAAIIEMYNAYDLKKLLTLEASSKINVVPKVNRLNASWRMKDSMKGGRRKVTIWHTEELQKFNRDKPKRRVCEVTGLYAKYLDPLTGKYYASKEAFKKIRDEYYASQEIIVQEHIKAMELELEQLS